MKDIAYMELESRIRMLEKLTEQINSKMNAQLMLLVSGVIIPLILKHLEN